MFDFKLSFTTSFWAFQKVLALPLFSGFGSFAPPSLRGLIGVKLILNEVNGGVRVLWFGSTKRIGRNLTLRGCRRLLAGLVVLGILVGLHVEGWEHKIR